LNIVLRDKGLAEEELVLWECEVLEFISCCSATALGGSISPFNGIIMNPANTIAVAYANRFLIGEEILSLEARYDELCCNIITWSSPELNLGMCFYIKRGISCNTGNSREG
jgi:hypothetical protein